MKVLISAYACEPGKGSEPGAGWNWSLAAARNHDVRVLTRANNRAAIEAEFGGTAHPTLRFSYVDLPGWARWWKRGRHGLRLYYTLWQFAALREARRLHRREPFDVVHHLTFASVWLPALVCLVDAPFVYGPVGGGPAVPRKLYGELGRRGVAADLALRAFRGLSRLNPLVRIAWARAQLVVVQNAETGELFTRRRTPVFVRPNASVPFDPAERRRTRPRQVTATAIFAGRLVPWKGASLAVRALSYLPGWHLEVIGEGPDEGRLRKLAKRLSLQDRVLFAGWHSQAALWERLEQASVLLFPSMKEDAGMVVVEAVALGTPVVALDLAGPAALAELMSGIVVVPTDGGRTGIARRLAQACVRSGDDVVTGRLPAGAPAGLACRVDDLYQTATRLRPQNGLFRQRRRSAG